MVPFAEHKSSLSGHFTDCYVFEHQYDAEAALIQLRTLVNTMGLPAGRYRFYFPEKVTDKQPEIINTC